MMPRFVHKNKGIDSTFDPYIAEYRSIIGEEKYEHKFKRLSFNFAKLTPGVLGRCYWLIGGGYEIEIDREWWNRSWSGFLSKKLVVFHELEHCIRFRLHTNRVTKINSAADFFDEIGYFLGIINKPGYLKDGCPSTVMNSSVSGYKCQSKHYNMWIKEMMDY